MAGIALAVEQGACRAECADELGEEHLATVDVELVEDHAHVVLHGAVGDADCGGDLLIRLAVHHEHEHLALLGAQVRDFLELELGEQIEEVGVGLPPEFFGPALIALHRMPGVRGMDLADLEFAALPADRDGRALALLHDVLLLLELDSQQIFAEHDTGAAADGLRIVALLGDGDERHGS